MLSHSTITESCPDPGTEPDTQHLEFKALAPVFMELTLLGKK